MIFKNIVLHLCINWLHSSLLIKLMDCCPIRIMYVEKEILQNLHSVLHTEHKTPLANVGVGSITEEEY